jgi:hypothetical protein
LRRCSTRGNRNAPKLDPVDRPCGEQVVGVDLVLPPEKVRLGLVGCRTEDGETQRHLFLAALSLGALEVGEPLFERGALCVTLAHRCHTVEGEGR